MLTDYLPLTTYYLLPTERGFARAARAAERVVGPEPPRRVRVRARVGDGVGIRVGVRVRDRVRVGVRVRVRVRPRG